MPTKFAGPSVIIPVKIKQAAVGRLANSMRLFVEANIAFKRLENIDLEEGIDNLDRAFEAKLEAFHSLYDVDKNDFDYFAHADCSLLILLRNAIHHRDHELFQSWNAHMFSDGGPQRFLGAQFLLASHRVIDAPIVMRQFYKAEDFIARLDPALNSLGLERKMAPQRRVQLLNAIQRDLGFANIFSKCDAERYPRGQAYINVIPIFISATSSVFKSLKARGVPFVGFDAATYERPFTEELHVDLQAIDYDTVRIT